MPWGDLITALLNGLFAVVVLVLGVRLNGKVKRVENDTRASRDQLVNGHDTNLREESDERHQQNTNLLHALGENVERLRRHVERIWERLDQDRDSIHQLELTQPPRSRFEPGPTGRHRKDQP